MAISQPLDPPHKLLSQFQDAWQQQLILSISVLPPLATTSLGKMNSTMVIINFTNTTTMQTKFKLLSHIQKSYDILTSTLSPDGDTLYITYE
jgi:hypothetical protein